MKRRCGLRDKRLQKLERHFAIQCNGTKVNILHYHLSSKTDGSLVLELITKIKSPALSQRAAVFEMNGGEALRFSGTWVGEFHQPNISRYYYRVERQAHLAEKQAET